VQEERLLSLSDETDREKLCGPGCEKDKKNTVNRLAATAKNNAVGRSIMNRDITPMQLLLQGRNAI
jgi:hypothetical protein